MDTTRPLLMRPGIPRFCPRILLDKLALLLETTYRSEDNKNLSLPGVFESKPEKDIGSSKSGLARPPAATYSRCRHTLRLLQVDLVVYRAGRGVASGSFHLYWVGVSRADGVHRPVGFEELRSHPVEAEVGVAVVHRVPLSIMSPGRAARYR